MSYREFLGMLLANVLLTVAKLILFPTYFLTTKYAVEKQYISGAVIDESFSSTLAEINLKDAVLTDRGRNKLAQLLTQSAKGELIKMDIQDKLKRDYENKSIYTAGFYADPDNDLANRKNYLMS